MDLLVLFFVLIVVWKMRFEKDINNEYLSFKTCQAWKGIFALVVVFHHMTQASGGGLLFDVFKKVGFLAVAVFFFFSGYGLQKKNLADSNYKNTFLSKRFPSVLIPYIIMTVVFWIKYAVTGVIYSVKDIFIMIFEGRPIVSHSWYVINILFFYLAFYLLIKCVKNNNRLIILGASLAYGLWVYICVKLSFVVFWYCSSHLLVVGIVWATYEQKIIESIKKHYYTTAVVVMFSFLISVILQYKMDGGAAPFYAVVIMKMISTALFTIIVLIFSMKVKIGNRVLEFLGKISFEIYLSHGLFTKLFRSNALYVENDLIWALLVLISTIIFSLIFCKLSGYILSKYNKLLLQTSHKPS